MTRAIIFAGPSLPPAARPVVPGIEWRPPARQGDVYRAALEGPAIIGVIDGVFEVVPTVWHKEILWAMSRGIHVYGAASIGALRAAELDVFGMVGVGRVYEAFRDGVLEDDDEVALLHGPEEVGYAPVTEAMVNVRATLECAVRSDGFSVAAAAHVAAVAKTIFYKDRTWPAIMASSEVRTTDLLRLDQKHGDALAMTYEIVERLGADAAPHTPDYAFAVTGAWETLNRSLPRYGYLE